MQLDAQGGCICYHGNKSAATFKKGIFVYPPWAPNCMQNFKGVENFHFARCLILTDLFLIQVPKEIIFLKIVSVNNLCGSQY